MTRRMVMTLGELCKYMESQEYRSKSEREAEEARQQRDKYLKEIGDIIEQHPLGVPHCSARGGIINFD